MKSHLVCLHVLLFVLPVFGERLIPVDRFYISVETNDWMNRKVGGGRMNVSVTVSRTEDNPAGNVSTEVDCYEFGAEQRMLPEADIAAFLEVGDAAREGRGHGKKVITRTFHGDRETAYEVVSVDGKRMVRMSRGDESADFMPEEVVRLREALAEAEAAEAWFRKLLAAGETPVPSAEAKPPRSRGYYLDSEIGTVSGRGLGYEVSVTMHPFGEDHSYEVAHTLCMYGKDGQLSGTTSGSWVPGLLPKISAALEAVEAGKAYSYVSGEKEGRKHSVVANLETKEADVILQPGHFFKGRQEVKGHFGVPQLAEIRSLIEGSAARIEWFQSNEQLFFEKRK